MSRPSQQSQRHCDLTATSATTKMEPTGHPLRTKTPPTAVGAFANLQRRRIQVQMEFWDSWNEVGLQHVPVVLERPIASFPRLSSHQRCMLLYELHGPHLSRSRESRRSYPRRHRGCHRNHTSKCTQQNDNKNALPRNDICGYKILHPADDRKKHSWCAANTWDGLNYPRPCNWHTTPNIAWKLTHCVGCQMIAFKRSM